METCRRSSSSGHHTTGLAGRRGACGTQQAERQTAGTQVSCSAATRDDRKGCQPKKIPANAHKRTSQGWRQCPPALWPTLPAESCAVARRCPHRLQRRRLWGLWDLRQLLLLPPPAWVGAGQPPSGPAERCYSPLPLLRCCQLQPAAVPAPASAVDAPASVAAAAAAADPAPAAPPAAAAPACSAAAVQAF